MSIEEHKNSSVLSDRNSQAASIPTGRMNAMMGSEDEAPVQIYSQDSQKWKESRPSDYYTNPAKLR